MIVGYLLFDWGGTLLVDEQFVTLLSEERESLFASIITAISHAMDKILDQKPRYLELERMHLYFCFREPFIFVLIADVESDEFYELAEEIMEEIIGMEMSPEDINFNPAAKHATMELIRKLIKRRPPSIRHLRRLANMLVSLSDFIAEKERADIGEILPGEYEWKEHVEIRGGKRRADIMELVDAYLRGELQDVIRAAPGLFGTEHDDYARILYARAGLTLRMYDPKIRAPPLEEIGYVIGGISDSIARKYLELEMRTFIELCEEDPYRDVLLRHLSEIRQRMQSGGIAGTIYDILFTPAPYLPLMEDIYERYRHRSKFLAGMAKEMKIILEVLHRPPKDVTEWLEMLSEIRIMFEDAAKRDLPEKYHLFHALILTLSLGILAPNLSVDDGSRIFEHFTEYLEKYQEKILAKSESVLSVHRGQSYYLMYNVILRPFFEAADRRERLEIIRGRKKRIIGLIRYMAELARLRRIPLNMYYVIMAGLLSMLTRMYAELGKAVEEALRSLPMLIDERLSSLWETTPHYYAQYYMGILDTIGNMAILLTMETVRSNILMRVAYQMERLSEMLEDMPMVYYLARMHAVRYYALSGLNEGAEKAKKIVKEVKKRGSPLLVHVFERVLKASLESLKDHPNANPH